ncbi:hypothetical protein BGV66_07350 [Burkholderia ubonensis]|uniref:Uncharacterized protein n=1 Tax=Burkholderia ubonensis TaxID=101571 RepID=A0ABD6Q7U5_9BURK|nr:hypothetical protein BGV66_07350 [Burkholderia ubonensis]
MGCRADVRLGGGEKMEAPPLIAAVAVHFIGVRGLLVDLVQVQGIFARWVKLDTVRRRPLRGNRYAERFECLEEERFARFIVADSEFDLVEHGFS